MARTIAELKSHEGLDVLVRLTPIVRRLASKESLIGLYAELAAADDDAKQAPEYKAEITERIVVTWFGECREELLQCIQIIDGVTAEDVEEMGPIKVLERVIALFKDPDFTSFFRSFVATPPRG